MFIKNKYTRYYYGIIEKAANRVTEGYTEKHHIIPRSIGGSNNHDNLVNLTGREHYVCHLLLTKMVTGQEKYKMVKAALMMAHMTGPGQERHKVTGRMYEVLKLSQPPVPQSTRDKNSKSQKERFKNIPGTFKNKKHTEETLKKLQKPKSEKQKLNQSLAMTGRFKGRIPHNKGKTYEELYGIERAIELKEKIKHPGEKNGFYGKQHSAEQRERKKQEKLAAPKKICYYCNTEVDQMNYGRWHGDKCKHK